jgi:copper chaperone CopZ
MTKYFMVAVLPLMMGAGTLHAEEKTCAVKGMHCDECAMTVKSKVCNDRYATCDVKVVSSKKQLGEIHLITKDRSAKIDEALIGNMMKESGYTLDKCSTKAADGQAS